MQPNPKIWFPINNYNWATSFFEEDERTDSDRRQ